MLCHAVKQYTAVRLSNLILASPAFMHELCMLCVIG